MESTKIENAEDTIRAVLEEMTGSTICLRANMGRSKFMECRGVIKQTHPSVFLIEVPEKRNHESRASYNYVDVLIGTVELFHSDSGESIFPWIQALS